ncbi:hypothetical protein ACP275_02G041500 [Erythranthe tilingii]
MDLGCIDMGCVEKDKSPKESATSASKIGKNSKAKDAVRSSLNALNKLTSQISKPPRRKTSPLNWFPRKKVEPYLKRKIKMLQEVDGMHSTLDETLGDSNPHYSRVLREKIAIKEAADKAMEARKAAMVEASWCRILQAARIESKEAEAELSKAEAAASEAFEAAGEVGVIMNDISDSAKSHYNIEIVSAKDTTHSVSATIETAFEVDKQVAAAVKAALVKLAHCPSINKDEFKELLRRISENPDENYDSDVTSECESDAAESAVVDKDSCNEQSDKFSTRDKIVEMMLDRIRRLKEDELASLATIVATSGLNAALAEVKGLNRPFEGSGRISSFCGRRGESELPSLDKFLVKRLTRLEREVLEAKNNARKNDDNTSSSSRRGIIACEKQDFPPPPSLDKVLVKRMSRLEREVQEAKDRNKSETPFCSNGDSKGKENKVPCGAKNYESLDSVLSVKHLSRLEKEKLEFRADEEMRVKPKRKEFLLESGEGSLDQVLVKHKSRLEREKSGPTTEQKDDVTRHHSVSRRETREKEMKDAWGGLSLGNSIRPHVSRLQRDKAAWIEAEEEERKRVVEGEV